MCAIDRSMADDQIRLEFQSGLDHLHVITKQSPKLSDERSVMLTETDMVEPLLSDQLGLEFFFPESEQDLYPIRNEESGQVLEQVHVAGMADIE